MRHALRLLFMLVLAVGVLSTIAVAPGVLGPAPADAANGARQVRGDFQDTMRKLWEDHITWTRCFIVSKATLATDLPDLGPTVARLLKNQENLGNAIKPIYGTQAGEDLEALLVDHILTANAILTAAKNGDTAGQAQAIEDWYENAHDIAVFLNGLNPKNWPVEAVEGLLVDHLDLTLDEAVARLGAQYTTDIARYDDVHVQILELADALSDGIIAQFPAKFAR